MKLILILFTTTVITHSLLFSQSISLTGVGSYTEDFNTLANSGTSSVVPFGWYFLESGTNANAFYNTGSGTNNAGDTYSFGTGTSNDRAFGGLLSGSLVPTIGAQFQNNTGFTITQLPITFTGEQWRAGIANRNAADRIDFQLSTDATNLATGTWIDYNSLDFNSPNINTTSGALDGNASGNRTTMSFTITGLSITNGSTFWIRWTDFNITDSDDGLAIDDFSINETSLPVELSSFSAIILDNAVKLIWRTATEVNNYGFEVQRTDLNPKSRIQNPQFEMIGFVQGHGNSNSPKDYSFIDMSVSGSKYSYRLKQIDTDGKFEYSKVIEIDFGSPAKFELSQNYPNPFNPSTTIKYSLLESGNVRLSIYNLLGEKVADLVNGFQEAGIHTINYNASELNSGVYVYNIESNGIIQSRKMALVK